MNENRLRLSRRDLLKMGAGLAVGAGIGYGVARHEYEPYKISFEEFTEVDAELFYKVISDYLTSDQNAQLWRDAFDATQPGIGKKARKKFAKFHGTNDLATTNILGMSYRHSKSDNQRNSLSMHIAEPDGFKQKTTEVDLSFSYDSVLPLDQLTTNALSFFKLPQEVIDADWESYNPKMHTYVGQYKRIDDQLGGSWLLQAVEYDTHVVNEKGNNIYESKVRLIREYPTTDAAPHYFIPTPIIR